MPKYSFQLNGKTVDVDVPDDLSVLWTLRDTLGVTGPKYGCGINVCQACTSLLDGQEFNPCITDVKDIDGRTVTTIEGIADGDVLHPVQEAWLEQDVAQCGFCQPGQIMAAVALLSRTRNPTDADIDAIENVCRCGTYFRVRQAIKSAALKMDARDALASPPVAGGGGGDASVVPVASPVPVATTSAVPSLALPATGPIAGVAAVGLATLAATAVVRTAAQPDGPLPL